MSAEISEICAVEQLQRESWLSTVAAPILALKHRFPFASRGLLSIFDQAIFSGTSFLTAALIGHTTSPDQLGMYYLLMSVVLIISGIQEQLVAAPYVVYSKRRRGRELAEYAGSMWVHYVVATTITVVALLIAIPVLTKTGQSKIVPGVWALLGAAPMLLFRQWIRRFTFANTAFRAAIALDATVAILQLSGLVLLGYFGLLSLFSIYAVIGIACGLACVAWFLRQPPRLRFDRDRFLSDWTHNWGFSKWALQTFVLGNTTPQLMLWMVGATIGAAATGMFGACSNLIGMTYVILCGVDNVLTPHAAHAFATGGVKDLRRVLLLAGSFVVLTMGAFCLLFLVTGDWLVVLAFGSHYQHTGAILVALAVSTLMNGVSIVVGNGLWAIEQPRSNFVADVCCMTVTLIAAALLIQPFGAFGAALATLTGTSVAAVVRLITLVRCLEDREVEPSVTASSALSS